MRYLMTFVCILPLLLAACADHEIDRAEEALVSARPETLEGWANFSQKLAKEYVKAGRRATTTQDIASFLVMSAAASTAVGLAGSTSDKVLARRAMGGVLIQQAGQRTVPKTAVQAIYNGAKRLNCVATTAHIADQIGFDDAPKQKRAAISATVGAIEHIRILTREGMLREIADFDTLLKDLTAAVPEGGDEGTEGLRQLDKSGDTSELNIYLKMLSRCTDASDTADHTQTDIPE